MACPALDSPAEPREPHPMSTAHSFTRARDDRMIAGVLGGIARRYGWSSTVLRVVFVLVSILSAAFPGILVYLILWLLMPEEGLA